MLTFSVHEPPNPRADRVDRAEHLAFVRDGFSWTAAVFTPFWLLAHRLWWPFVGYVGAMGAIALVLPGWISLAAIGVSLLIGLEAGTLRRWSLDRRGWTTLGSVSGRNAEDCERRFFDMWLPTQPVLAKPPAAGNGPGGRPLLGALSTTSS